MQTWSLIHGLLNDEPLLERLLRQANIQLKDGPGAWLVPVDNGFVELDLMVPGALDPLGGRSAKLGSHGNRTARRADGLEAALIDRGHQSITALDPQDPRVHSIWVAGPAALLVSKLHKIAERLNQPKRRDNKDALDVLRLLRATTTKTLGDRVVVNINVPPQAAPEQESGAAA
jgi:hypothetical protein